MGLLCSYRPLSTGEPPSQTPLPTSLNGAFSSRLLSELRLTFCVPPLAPLALLRTEIHGFVVVQVSASQTFVCWFHGTQTNSSSVTVGLQTPIVADVAALKLYLQEAGRPKCWRLSLFLEAIISWKLFSAGCCCCSDASFLCSGQKICSLFFFLLLPLGCELLHITP